MTYDEILARLEEVRAALEPFVTRDDDIPNDELEQFDALVAELDDLTAQRESIEATRTRQNAAAEAIGRTAEGVAITPLVLPPAPEGARTRDNDPWDLNEIRTASQPEIEARARTAVEATPDTQDRYREALTDILESPHTRGNVAKNVVFTTSPAYKSAFGKYLRDGDQSGFDEGERQAWDMTRAMAVDTDAAGGYLVPTDIEPAVTLASDGTDNPLYDLARRVQTTSDVYRVVQSPNATWSLDGENTEVSDDTPTMVNTDIQLYSGAGLVPISIEATMSIGGINAVAQDVLRGGYMDFVAGYLATGTGTSQPWGVINALVNGSQIQTSATTDVFAVADLYSTQDGIAARHRRRGTWIMGNGTINAARQFATDDGHALFARLGEGQPGTLLGRPLVEVEELDDVINAAADNYIAALMNFDHFVVAEMIGTLVEVIPHIMGANGRPIGARGVYAKTRFGSDVTLNAAGIVLNVT
jgi:HK97 family phage major capsid protein